MFGTVLVIFVFACIMIGAFVSIKGEAARKKSLQAQLSSFSPDELFVSEDFRSALGMKFAQRSIILYSNENVGEYSIERIASVEMLRDEVSLSATNRDSQAAGALAGGLLLGGVGLLAGALTGSKRMVQRFTSLDLKVIVDCSRSPVYVIRFFDTKDKKGVTAKDRNAARAIERLERFHAHIVNAIRNANSAPVPIHNAMALPDTSITNSLRQLWELRQAGALTEDDYEAAKRKMLSDSAR